MNKIKSFFNSLLSKKLLMLVLGVSIQAWAVVSGMLDPDKKIYGVLSAAILLAGYIHGQGNVDAALAGAKVQKSTIAFLQSLLSRKWLAGLLGLLGPIWAEVSGYLPHEAAWYAAIASAVGGVVFIVKQAKVDALAR